MPRTVVEEVAFTESVNVFRQNFSQIDDLIAELAWLLANDPLIGNLLIGENTYRVLETDPTRILPAFWILYRYDDLNDPDYVYLHAIAQSDE